MSAYSHKNVPFLHFKNRRNGLIKALTEDFEIIIEKCMSVLPGSTYTSRYVLIGLDDGTYEIRHPIANERLAPPCLPPFHGQVTKRAWLMIAVPSLNAWLISTLDPVFDALSTSDEYRLTLLQKVESLSDIQDDILSFHEQRSNASLDEAQAPSAASNILTFCENKSCMFIGELVWVECLVCSSWYHCLCVGIDPADDHRRDSFICGSCCQASCTDHYSKRPILWKGPGNPLIHSTPLLTCDGKERPTCVNSEVGA